MAAGNRIANRWMPVWPDIITCHRIVYCVAGFVCAGLFFQATLFAGDWVPVPGKANDVKVTVQGDVATIATTGGDPWMAGELARLGKRDTVLEFEFMSDQSVELIQLFFGPPFGKHAGCDLPGFGIARDWKTYSAPLVGTALQAVSKRPGMMRLDFGRKPGVRFQIRNLQLRPRTDEEEAQEKQRLLKLQVKADEASRIGDYLKEKFPLRVDTVHVQAREIVLSGGGLPPRVDLADLSIVEYPPWHSIGGLESGIPLKASLVGTDDGWQLSVPRRSEGRDRLHSGWRIFYEKGSLAKFISARRYATQIDPVASRVPTEMLRPANQKGMGGLMPNGPLDELNELGVTAITVNLPLGGFLVANKGPGNRRLDVPGEPLYFNSKVFARYDKMIGWASKHQVVVTAILLIQVPPKARDKHVLVHPENTAGPYSMPDLATERGAIAYSQVLEEVAKHYSNPDGPQGVVTNWMAHNEVDYHTVWTNMGLQPREVLTETYYRSMRAIYNAVRQYNPHARVFTSTTHHWTVPDNGVGDRLAPREFYKTLQQYSILEGDFAWGVGHHPYAQSLLAETAWQDKDAVNKDSTKIITMQNIGVLGRFLEDRSMLDSQRKPRPVLLSEQGYHSKTYGDQDQANQAASVAYAMKVIRSMPFVESFHYHRWIDHPKEGGKFGLRTLPTPQEKFGRKKRSWEVYRALGTDQEAEAIRGLPTP